MGMTLLVVCFVLLLQFVNCAEKETSQTNQNRIRLLDSDSTLENRRKLLYERQKKRCESCRESRRCKVQGNCELCTRPCKDFDIATILPPVPEQALLGLQLLENPDRFYTIGLFGPGPKQNLLGRLLNITRKDNLDQLLVLAKAKSVDAGSNKHSSRPVIIDTANIFGESEIEPQIHKINLHNNTESEIDLADRIEHKLDHELQQTEQHELTEAQVDKIIAEVLSNEKEDGKVNLEIPSTTIDTSHITTKRSVHDAEGIKRHANLKELERNGLIPDKTDIFQDHADNFNKNIELSSQHALTEQHLQQTDEVVTATHMPDNILNNPEIVGAINPFLLDERESAKQENHNIDEGRFNNNMQEMKELINGAKSTPELAMNNGNELNTPNISFLLKNLERQVENVADLVKKTCGKIQDSEVVGYSPSETSNVNNVKPKPNVPKVSNGISQTTTPDLHHKTINNAIKELQKDTELALNNAKSVAENLLEQVQAKLTERLELEPNATDCANGTGCSRDKKRPSIHLRSNFENDSKLSTDNEANTTRFTTEENRMASKLSEELEQTSVNTNDTVGCSEEEGEDLIPQYRESSFQNSVTNEQITSIPENIRDGTVSDTNVESNRSITADTKSTTDYSRNPLTQYADVYNDHTPPTHISTNELKPILFQPKLFESSQKAPTNRQTLPNQEFHITHSPNNENVQLSHFRPDSQNKISTFTDKSSGVLEPTESKISSAEISINDNDEVDRTNKQNQYIETNNDNNQFLNNKLQPTLNNADTPNTEYYFTKTPDEFQKIQVDESNINSQYTVSPTFDKPSVDTKTYSSITDQSLKPNVVQHDNLNNGNANQGKIQFQEINHTGEPEPSENVQEQTNVNSQDTIYQTTDEPKKTQTDIVGCSEEEEEIQIRPVAQYRKASEEKEPHIKTNSPLVTDKHPDVVTKSLNQIEITDTPEINKVRLELNDDFKMPSTSIDDSDIKNNFAEVRLAEESPIRNENKEIISSYPIPTQKEVDSSNIPDTVTKKLIKDVAPAAPMQGTNEKNDAAANRKAQTQENHMASKEMAQSEGNFDPQHTVLPFQENPTSQKSEETVRPSLLEQRFGESQQRESDASSTIAHNQDVPLHSVSSHETNINQDVTSNPLTIFGKIIPQKNNTELPFSNVPNNKIYFMGNGMQLPLNLKKGKDGSFQLSVDVDSLCTKCNKSCQHESENITKPERPAEVQKRAERKQAFKVKTMLDDVDVDNRLSQLSKRSPNFRMPLPLLNLATSRSKMSSEDDDLPNKSVLGQNLKKINKNIKEFSEKRLKFKKEYKKRNRHTVQNSEEVRNIPQQSILLVNNMLKWMRDFAIKNTNNQKDK